jgi:aspartate/methionine/tyrosine aminotransferase
MKFSSFTDRIGGDGAAAWKIHVEAQRAQRRGEDVIVLSVGDPDFATPAPIVERAVEALRQGDTHYAEVPGRAPLRAAIAADFASRTGVAYGPDNVMAFAGAQNGLFAASLCLLDHGDEAIALDPMYVTYEATIRASGAELRRVPQPAEGGFRPNPAAIEAAVTPRSRAIYLTSPNNPTGVTMSQDELAAIAEIARRHDLWVIADEVYAELVFDGAHHSIAGLPGMAERSVTVSSLSKSHAMTGWRVGWAIGPEALVRHFAHLGLCMLYGLSGFSQEAALTALTVSRDAAAGMREVYRRRRDLVCAKLAEAPGIEVLTPQAGMFVMADVRAFGLSGSEFAWKLYRETVVSLLDAGAFGKPADGWVRVSFTLEEARLEEACNRIVDFARKRAASAA